MTCEEFEELSGAYALDAVTPAERLAAKAHLATCARCTRLFQETLGVASLLPLSVPQIPPPSSLQGRILSVIRDESNSITGQPTQPRGDASVPSPRPHLSRPYGDVPGHFATRFVLCHSKPKSILPKLGMGTR